MVTGLDNLAERERRFLERVEEYRRRQRELATASGLRAEVKQQGARDLEVMLDQLLLDCANLAREPMLRHMAKITEAAATLSLTPRMHVVYPDPRKGAVAANPAHTPDLANVLTRMVTEYLQPIAYRSRFAGYNGFGANVPWYDDSAALHKVHAFIHDVVHLVDNPNHITPKEPGSHE